MNDKQACLYCEAAQVDTAPHAADWILKRGGAMRYRLLESYEACDFEEQPAVPLAALERTFAGRLFGPDAEIRWRRDGGKWHLWWLSEQVPADRTEAKPVRCRKGNVTRYYLVGVWRDGKYGEPHLKEMKKEEYPVPPPEKNGRLWLEVMEYFAEPPEQAEDPLEALNQPRLVAYRLVGLKGKDKA